MIYDIVTALPVPPQADRDAIAGLPKTLAAHDAYLSGLPCMTQIERGGVGGGAPLAFPFSIAAWNLERCLFPMASADLIRATGAAVVLLSEMDNGMSRTAQNHTTAVLAADLGMTYAYGVEFLELGLGSETEREFCCDALNEKGFHGNALMAAVGLNQPFMLRLPGQRHWFLRGGDQPRLGERMAIGAVIQTEAGPTLVVSTHLESVADAAGRARQMTGLIDAVEAQFPGLPVVIGGDLNTGNHIGGDFRDETLFAQAMARGFAVQGGPETTMTTRPSLITRWPERAMKLDWFLTRGVVVGAVQIIPSLDAEGRPLSDHDLITCRIEAVLSGDQS